MLQFALTALSLGFLGSFHCIGMCGPIALALPLERNSVFRKILGAMSYNAGRILTYSLFGALFGMLGYGLVIAGFQQAFSVIAGILIIAIVLLPGISKWIGAPAFMYTWIIRLKSKLSFFFKRKGFLPLFMTGIFNGLLPCGLVYMGITGAIVSGNAEKGSLFMALFGAGTLPAMFALSMISNSISLAWKKRIHQAMPVIIIGMGLILILRGMNLGVPMLSPEMSSTKPVCHKCCHK